ncbi:MAG: hypothetical protein QW813_03165 [Candidatus Aenigmatarchaeota archaeon]
MKERVGSMISTGRRYLSNAEWTIRSGTYSPSGERKDARLLRPDEAVKLAYNAVFDVMKLLVKIYDDKDIWRELKSKVDNKAITNLYYTAINSEDRILKLREDLKRPEVYLPMEEELKGRYAKHKRFHRG